MSRPELETDHSAKAVARLVDIFRSQPNFAALLETYLEELDDLEAAAFALYTAFDINAATGVQLDALGQIVGVDRPAGLDDDTYRVRVRAQILINVNSGTADEIVRILSFLLGPTEITEFYPAAFIVRIVTPASFDDLVEYARVVKRLRPAGVQSLIQYEPPVAFVFDSATIGFDGVGDGGFIDIVDADVLVP